MVNNCVWTGLGLGARAIIVKLLYTGQKKTAPAMGPRDYLMAKTKTRHKRKERYRYAERKRVMWHVHSKTHSTGAQPGGETGGTKIAGTGVGRRRGDAMHTNW